MGFPFKSRRLQEVEALKAKYFDEVDHETKAQLKNRIDAELDACFAAAKKSLGYHVTFDFESFFSEIFNRKAGFDVVIGNPPYINIENIPESDRAVFLTIYGENGKLGKRYDIYQLFLLRGMAINAGKGTLAYILPNTFLMGSSYLICEEDFVPALLFGKSWIYRKMFLRPLWWIMYYSSFIARTAHSTRSVWRSSSQIVTWGNYLPRAGMTLLR